MQNENYSNDTNASYDQNRVYSRMFNDRESAEEAYQDLTSRGYSDKDVNLVMSDATRDRYFKNDHDTALGSKAMDNAGKGSLIGGGIGALVGAIAAIGTSVLLPGLGLVIAGPLAAGLAGAGAGAAAGGLIGALTGTGVSEEDAARYEKGIKDGGIYMGFKPKNEEDYRYYNDRWNTPATDL